MSKLREGKHLTDLTGGFASIEIGNLVHQREIQEQLMRPRYQEYGEELLALKLPAFLFSEDEVEGMVGKARKYRNLILDLRGNHGGRADTLSYLVGGVFEHDVHIDDRVGRQESKPEIAKPLHKPFTGKLVVLVDSASASAAELFARIIQLEKRGAVVGDQTSGRVMEARHFQEQMGADTVVFYGASITEWDLIMDDGKSLEHTGVTPDEVVLPSARDLANGADPVLARAAEVLGVKIGPDDAGKAFPYEWPPE